MGFNGSEIETAPWYLVQIKPNGFRRAEQALSRQGIEVFCPKADRTIRRRNRLRIELHPLFAGYLFVSPDPERPAWAAINNTPGVSRLVSFGGRGPEAVAPELVAGLMMRCDSDGRLLPPEEFHPGDMVRIVSGPFADFVTTVDQVGDDQRIYLLLDLMGRKTRTGFERQALRKL